MLALVGALAAIGVAFSGSYNVAATERHWAATAWLLHVAKERAVKRRATDILVPQFDDQRIPAGAAGYAAMCAGCHGTPGGEPTVLALGLEPAPPDPADLSAHHSAAEIFWFVKYGVRMTGMPAWGNTHGDDELWEIVAFVLQMAGMTAQEYERLRDAGQAAGHHPHDYGVAYPQHPQAGRADPEAAASDTHGAH